MRKNKFLIILTLLFSSILNIQADADEFWVDDNHAIQVLEMH